MLRKVLLSLLIFTFTLTACTNKTSNESQAPAATSQETTTTIQSFDKRSGLVRASGRALRDDQGEFYGLGVTMMWALWAYKHDRAKLERNLAVLAENGFDYVRVLGVISREPLRPHDYWYKLDMNASWPDYNEMIAGLTDLAYDQYGLRLEWTIFGGAGDFNEHQKQNLVDRFIAMSRGREHKIMHFEIANEYEGTGWDGDSSIRHWTKYLNDRTNILVAASAAYQQTEDLCHEFQNLYAGGIADIGTWHFDRTVNLGDGFWRPVRQPWEYVYCSGLPAIGSNNEPLGPGSSVASDTDPMRNVAGAIVSYISGLPLHVYHGEAGVRADHGDYTTYYTNVTTAFKAMKSYLPKNVMNWSRQNHHWAGHPLESVGEIGYPPSHGSGAVRNFGAVNGNEFVSLPMGIKDYLRVRAKHNMKFCVIHPVTGEILDRKSLKSGETYDLKGQTALFVRGKMNSDDDGCDNIQSAEGSLKAGQSIKVGGSLRSSNFSYNLVYQSDNNLVLYNKQGHPLWASNTSGQPNPNSVEMQGDGNLVIYDKNGKPLWSTVTQGNPGAYLVLQNDGQLAIVNKDKGVIKELVKAAPPPPTPPVMFKAGQSLKPNESFQSANGKYGLVYQSDNNLVLYGPNGPLWASNTSGLPNPNAVEMQGDGNLVIYDKSGKPLWASDTSGHAGAYLGLHTNGQMVMYDRSGSPLKVLFKGE
ncbi:MAG: hypothetical protein AB7F59_10540 [Bdellovibrionales bacterium]